MKMKKILIATGAFFAVFLLISSIAWVGGYNFDHRGPDIASGYMICLLFGGLASGLIFHFWPTAKP